MSSVSERCPRSRPAPAERMRGRSRSLSGFAISGDGLTRGDCRIGSDPAWSRFRGSPGMSEQNAGSTALQRSVCSSMSSVECRGIAQVSRGSGPWRRGFTSSGITFVMVGFRPVELLLYAACRFEFCSLAQA